MKCEVCDKYDAVRKDYRHIDGLFYGKVYNCEWCNPLDDVSLYRIAVEKKEPKSFYDNYNFETEEIEEDEGGDSPAYHHNI